MTPHFGMAATTGYAGTAVPRLADPATLQALGGRTMGTTWSLKFDNRRLLDLALVRDAVQQALACVVAQMSTWEEGSEISRFNRAPAGHQATLSPEFFTVLRCALQWARTSGGAYDPTVGPLVETWRFGQYAMPGTPRTALPLLDDLQQARARVGFERLDVDTAARRVRQPGGACLDLSGIAKGFAVDHVLAALRALGIERMLVEVGGELRGQGTRPSGVPWRVQVPAPAGMAAPTVALRDMAIATSGDAWHAFEYEGRRYSHTIDPRTGEPVTHALRSVTVLHAECMQADALATALTVLGPEAGAAFAEQHRLAALFIGDGVHMTSAFRTLLAHPWP
jgi:FAD:protein FMN transferase